MTRFAQIFLSGLIFWTTQGNSSYAFAFSRSYADSSGAPNAACSLDVQARTLKLVNSQRTDEKNQFLVGWNFYTHQQYLHTQKPEVGGEIMILRCLPPGKYVLIAKGFVNKLNGNLVEAIVKSTNYEEIILGKETENLKESRNLIWRPMVGDAIFPVYKHIEHIALVSPLIQLKNNDLFQKMEDGSYSLDLSDEGKKIIRDKFQYFKKRSGRLLVEGFNLTYGNVDQLRTETLMRAQTVSTYLVREFGLAPSQVVAIGFGNDWKKTGMQAIARDESELSSQGVLLKMLNE